MVQLILIIITTNETYIPILEWFFQKIDCMKKNKQTNNYNIVVTSSQEWSNFVQVEIVDFPTLIWPKHQLQ